MKEGRKRGDSKGRRKTGRKLELEALVVAQQQGHKFIKDCDVGPHVVS